MLRAENPSGRKQDFATVAEYEASGFWMASKRRYRLEVGPYVCELCGDDEEVEPGWAAHLFLAERLKKREGGDLHRLTFRAVVERLRSAA